MDSLILVLTLIFGAIIGGVVVWLALHAKWHRGFDDGKAASATEIAALLERVAAKDREVQKLQETFEAEVKETGRLREERTQLSSELEGERREARVRSEAFEKAAEDLSGKFAELSRHALKLNSDQFLSLARSELEKLQNSGKGELDQRKQAIDQMVGPLKESLDKVDAKINELEKARSGAYAALRVQIESLASDQSRLQKETTNLVNALRTPIVRGRWGEIQLKRVVEIAGMIEYCDFNEQHTIATDMGKTLRPDMIIRLPNNRTIVVDSKAPLAAYLEALEARDEESRGQKLKDHAQQIKTHLSKLGGKAYWEQFEQSPEFVFMFLPGETFYSAALEQEPGLIEFGVDKRVILATPTTLIALLKAVSYGWQQEKMASSANEVSRLGKDLYDRLRVFTRHFENIGAGIKRALESYNDGVGSFEGRVLRTARKFKELGASQGDEISEIRPLDKTVRVLNLDEGGLFPDLVAGNDDDASLPLLSSKATIAGDDS